jgi:hypothetical protein
MYTMLQILFTKVGIFAQHVCTRMSRVVERSVNVARMSRECRTIVARLSHDCRTNVARMSHERRTNVACRRTWQHCLRTATWRIDQAWRSILGLNTCERGTLKNSSIFVFLFNLMKIDSEIRKHFGLAQSLSATLFDSSNNNLIRFHDWPLLNSVCKL